MKRTLGVFMLAGIALMLTGCDPGQMVDSQVQAKVQEYFPAAEISHPRRDVLLVQTHLGNITELFFSQVMAQLIRDHRGDLEMGLPLGGYSFLRVGYEDGGCTWTPQRAMFFSCSVNAPGAGVRVYPVYPIYGQ